MNCSTADRPIAKKPGGAWETADGAFDLEFVFWRGQRTRGQKSENGGQ